jgi:hypothetical protein
VTNLPDPTLKVREGIVFLGGGFGVRKEGCQYSKYKVSYLLKNCRSFSFPYSVSDYIFIWLILPSDEPFDRGSRSSRASPVIRCAWLTVAPSETS